MTPRQWGIAASVTVAMLTPAVLSGTGTLDWTPLSARSAIDALPVGVADLTSAQRLGSSYGDELGAGGRLPLSDQLSAALLAEVDDLSDLEGGYSLDGLTDGPLGVPGVVLDAYMRAEERLAETTPGCNLDWALLAGIGKIESGHARGGLVDADGDATPPILGPVLNGGPGMATILDTDDGRWDSDTVYDRAVGPMQFIPSTWAGYAADGNEDEQRNPNNVYDATIGAGNYLCSGGGDLTDPQQRAAAVFRYNHSDEYVRNVLTWADAYADGVTPLPNSPGEDLDAYDFSFADDHDGLSDVALPGSPGATTTTTTSTSGGVTTTTTVTTTTQQSQSGATTTTRTAVTLVPSEPTKTPPDSTTTTTTDSTTTTTTTPSEPTTTTTTTTLITTTTTTSTGPEEGTVSEVREWTDETGVFHRVTTTFHPDHRVVRTTVTDGKAANGVRTITTEVEEWNSKICAGTTVTGETTTIPPGGEPQTTPNHSPDNSTCPEVTRPA